MKSDRRSMVAAAAATLGSGMLVYAARAGERAVPSSSRSAAGHAGAATARLLGYFPNIELTTHDGRRVRFYDDLLRDRTVVIAFMYTSCDSLCPLAMENLLAVGNRLGPRVGRDIFLLGVTLDPALDTPDVLADYARSIGAGPGVTFLTGGLDDITQVRRKLGVFDPDPVIDADRSQHSGLAVIGNEPAGRWAAVPALAGPTRILRTLARIAPDLAAG
jgi:protein SCO1/2